MIPPPRGEMGGLRFHVSETGKLIMATMDVLEWSGLNHGQDMSRLLYRIPNAHRRRLKATLKTITENEIPGMFTHPMLDMDLKTVWYKWQIQPIRRERSRGFYFCGIKIEAPRRCGDIEVHFSYHGVMWKEKVGGTDI